MKNKIILIDAAHREETRIAVLENGILQDFDREAIAIKQIKGNIYLAKVTRVEQSLQAAFVDYGSDKHGFLPFGDIHPNYFQISEEERQGLLNISEKNNEDDLEEPQEKENEKSDDEENLFLISHTQLKTKQKAIKETSIASIKDITSKM